MVDDAKGVLEYPSPLYLSSCHLYLGTQRSHIFFLFRFVRTHRWWIALRVDPLPPPQEKRTLRLTRSQRCTSISSDGCIFIAHLGSVDDLMIAGMAPWLIVYGPSLKMLLNFQDHAPVCVGPIIKYRGIKAQHCNATASTGFASCIIKSRGRSRSDIKCCHCCVIGYVTVKQTMNILFFSSR